MVTGGAGFIGSHIVDSLIAEGHRVAVVDNLRTGRKENIHPEAVFYMANILDDSLRDAFLLFQPDVVYHLAALGRNTKPGYGPKLDALHNIIGTISVLEYCVECKVKKIIYASSTDVYGQIQPGPVDESNPARPSSFHGISKHTPEHYVEVYGDLFGLDYTVLRFSHVFGKRQEASGEAGNVAAFAAQLMGGGRQTIYGTGEEACDLLYVKDAVSAALCSLTRGGGRVFNISRNERITLNELLRTMCRLCGMPFSPVYIPSDPGEETEQFILDNHAALQVLGWKPMHGLRDSLMETLDDCRRRHGKVIVDRFGSQEA
jgi:UDP-glucose 4-epimerase